MVEYLSLLARKQSFHGHLVILLAVMQKQLVIQAIKKVSLS